jgi:hypothetical protein
LVLGLCSFVVASCGGSSTSAPPSSAARAFEEAQAQPAIARALKVVASDREDFHNYTLVSPVTLKNLDHSLTEARAVAGR